MTRDKHPVGWVAWDTFLSCHVERVERKDRVAESGDAGMEKWRRGEVVCLQEQGQNMLWAGDWDDGDDMGAPAHGGHGGAGDADPDAGPGAGNHHGGVGGANHHGGAWGANHHGGVGDAPGGGGHGGGPGAGGGGGGNEGERTVDLEARNEDVGLEDMVVVAPKGDGARVELNATWVSAHTLISIARLEATFPWYLGRIPPPTFPRTSPKG